MSILRSRDRIIFLRRTRRSSKRQPLGRNPSQRPLPSAPYEQHSVQKTAPEEKENEYEELQQFKNPRKKRRRGNESRDGEGKGEEEKREGEGVGEREGEEERKVEGEMEGEGEGGGKGPPRFEEEGEWLVVRGIYSNKEELEVTTESFM